MRQVIFFTLTCMAALLSPAALAQAPAYPASSVHILVGYPPGGASDIVARMVAEELAKLNKQAFVVENRPGVGGMLCMSLVAKAPADGYTLGLGVSGTLTTGPHLQTPSLYDPLKDFEPIGPLAKTPMVLLAGPSANYDNVQGLVNAAKAHPGEIMHASGAQAFELALQLFKLKAGVDIGTIQYKGGAAASLDVIGGRIPLMIDTIGAQQENIKAGKLRPLAVLDSSRSPVLPNVPTVAESGVAGYEAVGWTALVAPKGTAPAIVAKLNEQIKQVLERPEIKQKLLAIGFEPWYSSPKDFERTIASEYEKWGEVVRSSGMSVK